MESWGTRVWKGKCGVPTVGIRFGRGRGAVCMVKNATAICNSGMDLEGPIQSKISLSEADKCHLTSFICECKEQDK